MFETHEELQAHSRAETPCGKKDDSLRPQGVSPAQLQELKSRKKNPDASEEEKWRDLYRLLFPEDDRMYTMKPCKYSPYFFYVPIGDGRALVSNAFSVSLS